MSVLQLCKILHMKCHNITHPFIIRLCIILWEKSAFGFKFKFKIIYVTLLLRYACMEINTPSSDARPALNGSWKKRRENIYISVWKMCYFKIESKLPQGIFRGHGIQSYVPAKKKRKCIPFFMANLEKVLF